MYTPTRIAGREAVFEFLPEKLRSYPFIYIDVLYIIIMTVIIGNYDVCDGHNNNNNIQ